MDLLKPIPDNHPMYAPRREKPVDKTKHFRITLADGETVDQHFHGYYIKGGCICFCNNGEHQPRLTLARGAWSEVRWVQETA